MARGALRPVIQATLWASLLVAPVNAPAQHAEPASVWQFGMREVEWSAVEQLLDEVRDYRESGAIGPYELRIRTNGSRFDVFVEAEIRDETKLADLRQLKGIENPSEDDSAMDGSRSSRWSLA